MSFQKSVFLTAANRPDYFSQVAQSWSSVRWQKDWNFVIRLEPTSFLPQMLEIAESFKSFPVTIHINDRVIGAPMHPWHSFEDEYARGSEYVVSVEDDLLVSDDFFEYHSWASEHFLDDKEISNVSSYSFEGSDPSAVSRRTGFVSWGFGVWRDRWEEYIRDTWDGNYSTYENHPGDRSGWDWNLNLRVLPSRQKKTIFPDVSRIQNIGIYGVHGDQSNFVQSLCFEQHRGLNNLAER